MHVWKLACPKLVTNYRRCMRLCDWIWEKPPFTHTTARHTFHHQMIVHTLTNNSTRESCPGCFCCSLFLWLVRLPQCSGCPQMTPYLLDNHTASCNSPHNWLMSLIMDLATLCDMWRWNGTNGYHLAAFIIDVTFAHHFVANHPSSTLPFYRSASGIGYTCKNAGDSASYSPSSWWIDRL